MRSNDGEQRIRTDETDDFLFFVDNVSASSITESDANGTQC
jgi:hypothetical protein